MTKEENKEITLLIDTPEEEVLFGFDEYASILTATIMGTKPHFTIGIFGSWGCGKTTLLKRIESQLKTKYAERVLVVSFDAWRYQHEEHFILALLNTLSLALKGSQSHWQTLGENLVRFSKCLVAATSVNTPLFGVAGDKALKQLQKPNNDLQCLYYDWLNQLQLAVSKIRQDDPKRRIVILIDDIDRCLPNKVVEILESIKVMLDVEGFVFILALDHQIAEIAVQSRYGEQYSNQGRDYLKKLVQVEFRIPPLGKQDIIAYTGKLSTSLELASDEISSTLAEVVPLVIGDNLREVKRFINGVILGTAIMHAAKLTVSFKIQVAFMAMDFRWAGIMRTLTNNHFFEDLSAYLKKDTALSSEDEANVKKIL
jgi:hypothetical protein